MAIILPLLAHDETTSEAVVLKLSIPQAGPMETCPTFGCIKKSQPVAAYSTPAAETLLLHRNDNLPEFLSGNSRTGILLFSDIVAYYR